MTKQKALYEFFNSFGVTAYPLNAVPEETQFPFLTYGTSFGQFGERVPINVEMYFHTNSETTPNKKVEQLFELIGYGGKVIPCDNGAIRVMRGNPFCVAPRSQLDASIKVRSINVILEYLTTN